MVFINSNKKQYHEKVFICLNEEDLKTVVNEVLDERKNKETQRKRNPLSLLFTAFFNPKEMLKNKEKNYSVMLLQETIHLFLILFKVLLAIATVILLFSGIGLVLKVESLLMGILMIVVSGVLFLFSVLSGMAAEEILETTDKYYIITLTSTYFSFISLIMTVIASFVFS